jgi:hypothetical protein
VFTARAVALEGMAAKKSNSPHRWTGDRFQNK